MALLNKSRTPMPDEDIIELYWQRDEAAIDETDFKYRKYLFTVAYNILYNKEDCEECLDDTYVGAWEAMPPQRPSFLKAFLMTVIRRVSINRYNEKNRQKRVPSALTESLSDLEGVIFDTSFENEDTAAHLGKIISDFVRSLSKRQRYIFMSRYYVAEPIEKIAAELGVSKSTVNKDISAIKSGLEEALGKEGYKV
ncbi:MAG: RNA polymerase sigma factor [Eubacteriales bacterium]